MKYDYFYNIRGIRFIWHGTNSDPELSYKGKVVNYYMVEDYWGMIYKEECDEHHLPVVKDNFPAWIKARENEVKEYIKNL